MIFIILLIVMAMLLLAAAIYSIVNRDLLFAVMGTGIVSVILSLFFYLLQAPDVALTEAAMGIALTTIIFIITIRNTTRDENEIIDKEEEMKMKTDKES